MKFRMGQISKMSGFSPTAIRHLEDTGIISPVRGANKKYRDFDLLDFMALRNYKAYRNLGFGLEEAEELINEVNPVQLKEHLKKRKEIIHQEIQHRIFLAKYIDQYINTLDLSAVEGQSITVKRSPVLLRIKMWQPGCEESKYVPYSQTADWYEKAPIADACVILDADDVLHKTGEIETDWGLAIEEKTAIAIGFKPEVAGERFPSKRCIHTLTRMNDNITVDSDQFVRVRQYLLENHLAISGPVIGRKIYHSLISTQSVSIFELYVPIKKKK